jgi:hypothetical protein
MPPARDLRRLGDVAHPLIHRRVASPVAGPVQTPSAGRLKSRRSQ